MRFAALVQQHVQQSYADLDVVATVLDDAKLPELVHEEIEVAAAGADHLGQRLLIDPGHDRYRLLLAAARQDQQKSRQALLG
jgi:hypothetical protein